MHFISCGFHGLVPWKGDLTCCSCHRCYRIDLSKDILYDAGGGEIDPPGFCACGKPLMVAAAKESGDPEAFTARMICPSCAAVH